VCSSDLWPVKFISAFKTPGAGARLLSGLLLKQRSLSCIILFYPVKTTNSCTIKLPAALEWEISYFTPCASFFIVPAGIRLVFEYRRITHFLEGECPHEIR
ncbi:MAG: hypothetical protein PHV82_16210, partial [Victivallaceae bacterium]|nr:hypothetical protein [Victivallaceae bacterium]